MTNLKSGIDSTEVIVKTGKHTDSAIKKKAEFVSGFSFFNLLIFLE